MENARKKKPDAACAIVSLWPGESATFEVLGHAGATEIKVIAAALPAGHCSRVARLIQGFYCPGRN